MVQMWWKAMDPQQVGWLQRDAFLKAGEWALPEWLGFVLVVGRPIFWETSVANLTFPFPSLTADSSFSS